MYLDCKGLLAVWREGLLARKVLAGLTTGYRKHPQLERFKETKNPAESIDVFLSHVLIESQRRCYHFETSKINFNPTCEIMEVTSGQLEYEFEHLKLKLENRDKSKLDELLKVEMKTILQNPVFKVVPGKIEHWEKIEK